MTRRERESNNNNNGHGLLGTSTSKRMDAKTYGMRLMYSRKTGLHSQRRIPLQCYAMLV